MSERGSCHGRASTPGPGRRRRLVVRGGRGCGGGDEGRWRVTGLLSGGEWERGSGRWPEGGGRLPRPRPGGSGGAEGRRSERGGAGVGCSEHHAFSWFERLLLMDFGYCTA